MKGVRTMFGRLFLSTGSDTFAGAKATSFAPSAPPYSIYDRLVLTITCPLPSSKKNEFFLRRRVARPKIMDFFCAAGLQVKKQWIFSAPQGCKSKNDGRFLRRRVASQKTMAVFCAVGLQVKKRRLRQHKMLHLNKKTAKKLVHKHFFSTFEALINRRVSNTALTQQAIEKDELRDNPICKLFGSRVHNATTLTGTRPAGGVTLEKITTLNVQKRDA